MTAFQLIARLKGTFSTIVHVWADSGYESRFVTATRQICGVVIEVVTQSDQNKGFVVLPRRWVVERTFGWLLKHRRLVRDYETLPETHEAIWAAGVWTLSRQLTR